MKTFTYNANGELTSETNSATSITRNFVYDVFGNLKQVTLPSKTVNYAVDAQNRRIIKKDGTTIENYFIWNANNQLIGITDGAGILISRFVYGSKSHVADYMMRSGVNYQIVSNHLGSPVAVVNSATGVIVQEITYDEFGNKTSDSAPGFIPFGFAGCLYDEDTGLCRFGARDYDSSIGRWLSKDPILFGGGDTNLYGYVMQDPINLIDPMGTKFINVGVSVPSEVQNSHLYKTIDADPNVTVLLTNFSDPRYFGLTTGNSVQINAALHRGNYKELVDTFTDELSHVFGNNYYGIPTSETFDHNFLKPSFLSDPSIKNSNKCGF